MLKEQTYIDASEEFGTPVGVAHIIGYKNKKEQIQEAGIQAFTAIEPELDINGIICDAIELGIYKELQREIYKIRQKGDKRLKERGIYIKAFTIALNDYERNLTKLR
jgi:DNA-binding LacI/PurR family transcriptional regulator